jgi:hypothetical protein
MADLVVCRSVAARERERERERERFEAKVAKSKREILKLRLQKVRARHPKQNLDCIA